MRLMRMIKKKKVQITLGDIHHTDWYITRHFYIENKNPKSQYTYRVDESKMPVVNTQWSYFCLFFYYFQQNVCCVKKHNHHLQSIHHLPTIRMFPLYQASGFCEFKLANIKKSFFLENNVFHVSKFLLK